MLSKDHAGDHSNPSFLATLRLAPLLPTKVAVASFPDVENAVNAVQEILNSAYGTHVRELRRSCTPRWSLTVVLILQNASNY